MSSFEGSNMYKDEQFFQYDVDASSEEDTNTETDIDTLACS